MRIERGAQRLFLLREITGRAQPLRMRPSGIAKEGSTFPGTGAEHLQPARRRRYQRQGHETTALSEAADPTISGDAGAHALKPYTGNRQQWRGHTRAGAPASPALL